MLFIRTGRHLDGDPIESAQELFSDGHEKIGFAKFGKPFGDQFIKRLFQHGPDAYLALFRSRVDREVAHLYKIEEVSRSPPVDVPYPDYYKSQLAFASSWITISASDVGDSIRLERLIVTSSRNRLRMALSSSMASFFLCSVIDER